MTTFLFLHGSFHAAWNWHKVLPLVEASGHRGIALDLPGHGRDRTPASKVTLARCVDHVVDQLDEPAVIVAHSRNGIVASEIAERIPDRCVGLAYLAAYLIPTGHSMMEYALGDTQSLVVQNIDEPPSPKRLAWMTRILRLSWTRWLAARVLPRRLQTHSLARRAYTRALYHDCAAEIAELADVLLEPEPNWAGFTPLALTPERYGTVPKVYVECLEDRAVTLELQRRMLADTPCDHVFSLASGHSPFFSQPTQLVQALLDSLPIFSKVRGATSL